MKKAISMAAAIVLPLTIGTAVADDTGVSVGALPVPMSDQELEQVAGGYRYRHRGGDFCFYCGNSAHVLQANLSHLSAFVAQGNYSGVDQQNN